MRFLSLFSGIEAASVAFRPLGWECVAVAEIEPFPCRLLAHYYPDVPNLGDVTKITREQIEALGHIDIVCGGFPCQDLSVAGKRAGLRNADGSTTRSGLFFDAMRIVGWTRARWLWIENVPGLYSNNGGRDFAAVAGAMAGCEFDVPKDGWRNAGAAVGPQGLVEWRCLDAQFFGLARRRERVFLVRDSGDWANRPSVLLEPEGLRGDPAPRREAGQAVARPLAACPAGGSGYRNDADTADNLVGIDREDRHTLIAYGGNNTAGPIEVATALNASASASGRMDFESEMFIAFDTTQITSRTNRSQPREGGPCHPLAAQAHAPAIAFNARQDPINGPINGPIDTDGATSAVAADSTVRRITPLEAERLQGFPDKHTRIPERHYKHRKITKLRPADRWEPAEDGGWWLMSADGPRYRGLGNSWAVPCVAWIARRIDAAHRMIESMTVILASLHIPIKTVSEANRRDHWRTKADRAKKQRLETWASLHGLQVRQVILGPLVVTLTRIGPRRLDSDNLAGSLKACRDGVADWLKIDDGSERIEWRYAQRSEGKRYGIHVEVACA